MEEVKEAVVPNAPIAETQDDGLYYPPGYKERNAQPEEQRKVEPMEDPTEPLKKAWEEDRSRLDKLEEENRELKLKLSTQNKEGEDLEGLTEEERVEKLLARREEEKAREKEASAEKEKREIRFLKTTDKFFVENEKEIMKLKREEGLTIQQAAKIVRKQSDLIAKYQGNKPEKTKTPLAPAPKKTAGQSFGDMYREGI